jgi:hypothetical protein
MNDMAAARLSRSAHPSIASVCGALLLVAGQLLLPDPVSAQAPNLPQIETNERYVDAVTRDTTLALTDEMAVFAFVFNSLPDRVKVYPTENYYYFRFVHNGVRYAGDIRLGALIRDQGKVYFGYYEELSGWKLNEGKVDAGVILDETKGVKVERVEPLVYRITYKEKSVVFALNDLSQVKPPANALGPGEKFIGPIFDESAIRFFFVYNTKLKLFHYILDETIKVADEFEPLEQTDRILVGKRTGLAFYRDHKLDRKILIGAFEGNVLVNNYFDGPFDQLPENFIEGDSFRDMIVDSDPSVKGKLDRLWHYNDGSGRYLVGPYLVYRNLTDLLAVHRCAADKRLAASAYYACFVFDNSEDDPTNAQPLAMKKRFPQNGK